MKSWCKTWKLSKNKFIEIQLDLFLKDCWELFNIHISHNLKGDHCGFQFEISFYKIFNFHFFTYDNRHWDWEKDCFEIPVKKIENKSIKRCFACGKIGSYSTFNHNDYCVRCMKKIIRETIKVVIK